ncbi:MAG: Bacterial Ig-like domain [Pseudomonadota bacterium]
MTRRLSTLLFAMLLFAMLPAACTQPVTPAKSADPAALVLRIVSVTPDTVTPDGSELVTVATRNGCAADDAALSLDGAPVAGFRSPSPGIFQFPAPARDTAEKISVPLELRCAKPLDGTAYAVPTASATLSYDPALASAPFIQSHSPVGDGVARTTKVVVLFSRPMNPSSLTTATVGIEGVPGTTSYDEASRTATFAPSQPLDLGRSYTAFVKAGSEGVRSTHGRPLESRLAPAGAEVSPERDAWTFTTLCEGCGVPAQVVGDVGTAAGLSRNAKYKLFSITGQAGSPVVGTAAGANGRVEAGFGPVSDAAP